MNLRQQVQLTCVHCNSAYSRPPSIAVRSKYCGIACANAARIGERKEVCCEQCGVGFLAAKDHGKWPRFCSRDCFEADAVRPTEKECAGCGSMFLALRSSKSEDRLMKFCSTACRDTAKEKGEHRACLNCGSHFYAKAQKAQARESGCCSKDCQYSYYRGAKNKNWKNGWVAEDSGVRFIPHKRDGYVTPYAAEHRVVAGRHIGRALRRNEPVLHLNSDKADNRPDNLYVCDSISTMKKILEGSLPWPGKSNLGEYA